MAKTTKNYVIINDWDDALEEYEWADFMDDVLYYDDETHPHADSYVITGSRATHPQYSGYIGKGGKFKAVECSTLRQAIKECFGRYADYFRIEETKGGCLVMTTIDHDGSNTFKIYKKVNGRRCNLHFRKVVYGC